MKNRRLRQIFETICFLPIILLVGVKFFVIPAMGGYLLLYFLFAGDWNDATFAPYVRTFFTVVAPTVLLIGVVYLVNKFHSLARN
jgi:hypothetical protein